MTNNTTYIDDIINRLLGLKDVTNINNILLKEDEIISLCMISKEIFMKQPMLLEITINTSLYVCGDIHGQFKDLLRCFSIGGHPPEANYLFLGDYVDRGKQSIEKICLLFAYKIKYPDTFYLLRGNHECATLNRIYGFYDECKRKYSVELWKMFTDCFNCLPVVAIIEDKIFCCHGGLSPELNSMDQIKKIGRPTDVPEHGLLCDLLWADPCDYIKGWGLSKRGISFQFGEAVVNEFLRRYDFDLIVRAHQVVQDGYAFFAQRKLVTVFSAPNYCGELHNLGAVMKITADLSCTFSKLRGKTKTIGRKNNI